MAVFKFRFVLLAAVISLALVLGVDSVGPRVASAAGVNIDPTSCGGVGHPNCASLPANVTIGANSCTVLGACDNLVDGIVIGDGSCNGIQACYGAGGRIGNSSCTGSLACYTSGTGGSIGDDSCNGTQACFVSGDDGSSSVGDGSCNGTDACYGNGNGGSGSVGGNSCTGKSACFNNGAGGSGLVGNDSCQGAGACFDNGFDGGIGRVGDNSCNATDACFYNGSEGNGSVGDNSCNGAGLGACNSNGYDGGSGSIGDNSCNSDSACYNNGTASGSSRIGDNSCNADDGCYKSGESGTSVVGENSCNGDFACQGNGFSGNGGVGNYSCNADSACTGNGFSGNGIIGNFSCSQSGTYNANCQESHADVGNCMYNDTTPVLCTQGTVQVEKVVVGNSSDRFNLKIDGVVQASAVGDGGMTDPVAVDPGTHSVGESAVYPARLSDYDQRTTCEAYNAIVGSHSHTIVPRTRGAAIFNVSSGDVVTCTITNTNAFSPSTLVAQVVARRLISAGRGHGCFQVPVCLARSRHWPGADARRGIAGAANRCGSGREHRPDVVWRRGAPELHEPAGQRHNRRELVHRGRRL